MAKILKFTICTPIAYQSGTFTTLSRIPPHLHSFFGSESLGDCRNLSGVDNALEVFDKMSRMRPRPSIKQFNSLLSSRVKLKEYSVALSIFNDMRRLRIPINEYTMNIAINSCSLSNRTHYGFSVLGLSLKLGYVPTDHTFCPLLKGLFRENKISEAQDLLKKIVRERLCEMNVVLYGCVVDGLCKSGNFAVAVELVKVMEKSGVKANEHIHNILIHCFCADGVVDTALKIFYRMHQKGISPDIVTYSSLIFGLCNLSRWNEVTMLLKEMMWWKIYPNVVTLLP